MPINALSMLTRMRQLTLHPSLVPRNYVDELRTSLHLDGNASSASRIIITPEEKLKLQHKLFQITEDSEDCPICFDALRDAVITSCAHAFCRNCIMTVIQKDLKCPMVRTQHPSRFFQTRPYACAVS